MLERTSPAPGIPQLSAALPQPPAALRSCRSSFRAVAVLPVSPPRVAWAAMSGLPRLPLLACLTTLSVMSAACASGSPARERDPATPRTSTSSPTPTSTPSPSYSVSPNGGDSLASFFGPDFNPGANFCTFSDQVVSIAGGVLTVIYPTGSTAPSMGPPYGGAQICEPFSSGPRTSATLTYRVRFPVGFEFVKGGKLPGLYGGTEPFSGGSHNSGGWSTRLMWRAGGAGEIYAYIAGVSGYGLDLGRGNFVWPADGKWHTVSLHDVLNTPGQPNGEAVLSLDGKIVVDATGLDITDTETPISGLFFSSFYGGHDPSWAPSAEMHIDFTGFSVS